MVDKKEEIMYCTNCGKELKEGSSFCTNCGAPTGAQKQPREEEPEQNSGEDWAEREKIIIQQNTEYYTEQFLNIRETGKAKMNWASFFLGLYHAAYRGLWKEWLLAMKYPFIVGGIALAVLVYGVSTMSLKVLIGTMCLAMVSGIWEVVAAWLFAKRFNCIYMKHVEAKMVSGDVSPDPSGRRAAISAIAMQAVIWVLGVVISTAALTAISLKTEDLSVTDEEWNTQETFEEDISEEEPSVQETPTPTATPVPTETPTPTVTAQPTETPADTQEYILPESNTRYLSYDEISSLDKETLRLARNEIYARHGRIFTSEDLNTYFSSKSWYHGTVPQESFSDDVFNEFEKANLELITQAENAGSADIFVGNWWDRYSSRCHMDIESLGGTQLKITINWSSSASENTTWTMTGEYDAATGYINYHDCAEVDQFYPNDGNEGPILTTIYTNGTGRFHLAGGYLYWEDYMEGAGDLCFFEKE